MENCKTEQEYIEKIAAAAQRACKRYGYLPSVLIGQACLENGYGIPSYWDNPQIAALMQHNNMVGIKSQLLNSSWTDIGLSVWSGESLTKQTPEVYNGKQVTITDDFRIYESIEQSFVDFLLFLTYASNYGPGGVPKYGEQILSIKTPSVLIQRVNELGYATGTTYATSVMKIVMKHGLTKYDDLSKTKATEYIPPALKEKSAVTIIKTYITTNNSNNTNEPRYIVIHNTDNFNAGADALAHAKALYNGDISGMSWHYAVDDHSIYQCLPSNRGAWHVGKNYGSGNLFGTVHNRNSVGIEICVNKGYDYEAAFLNAVELTKFLMQTHGISADRVLQHYDVCSKNCPSQIRARNDWARFKKLIGGGAPSAVTITATSTKSYLQKGDTGEAVKTMQTMLNACGYSCGVVDGDFGNNTLAALKAFQSANGLTIDGLYGANSKAKLEALYKAKTTKKMADEITVTKFCSALKTVTNTARTEGWKYGDSHATPPCSDKTISCDRLIARALYELGFTDQRAGGETCGTLDTWLKGHGFTRSTNAADIKKGSIVLVKHTGKTYIGHAFVATAFNSSTWASSRYDAGSNKRIRTAQPIKNIAWAYRKDDVIVYNIPTKTTAKTTTTTWKGINTATSTIDGLNVRDGAGKKYKVLRTANKGNRFEVDGQKRGGWVHINIAGTIGWVYNKYIKYD